jgi:hypothetical protein
MRVLVLPGAMALSDGETAAITSFAAAGGAVLAAGETGTFDGHLRRRSRPALGDFVLAVRPGGWRTALLAAFVATGMRPPLVLPAAVAAPTVTIRQYGLMRLVGIQAAQAGAAPLRMELGPGVAEAARYVRDLLGNASWRESKDTTVALNEDGMALLAFAAYPPEPPQVTAPGPTRAGTTAAVRLRLDNGGIGPPTVLRVELRDPLGRLVRAYSGNVKVPAGPAGWLWQIPFAVNDPPGDWMLSVHDPLGGSTATQTVPLLAPSGSP